MKHTFSIVIAALAASVILSCTARTEPITLRAQKQFPISFQEYLDDYGVCLDSLKIDDIKTVYDNDSLSILQFSAYYRDTAGRPCALDYRYIYLFDRMMSAVYERPVFNESFENILCMTDEQIERLRIETEKEGTSIYMLVFGQTGPVRTPYDLVNTNK